MSATRDARRMERREVAVLKRFGFANPYRSAVMAKDTEPDRTSG